MKRQSNIQLQLVHYNYYVFKRVHIDLSSCPNISESRKNMQNAIEKSNFLNRLSALQRLCSDTDPDFPKALLFVPGQDGRYNKGSITLIKYLFRGCVAKELFDETLESQYEPLEDMVVLVQSNSLSLILRSSTYDLKMR